MRLSHLKIQNFQILTHLDLELDQPITLFAADMEQGKSSLAEAVRLALTGETTRVDAKKDYPELVRDGAKKASGAIQWQINPNREYPLGMECVADFALPGGELDGQPVGRVAEILPYLLDPARLAGLDPNTRRDLLFTLIAGRPDADAIARLLVERDYDATKASEVAPAIVGSYDAGRAYAIERAKAARAEWKGITGETYGSKKAADWQAPRPDWSAERIAQLEQELELAETAVSQGADSVGQLRARHQQALDQAAKRRRLHAAAADHPRLAGQLSDVESQLHHHREAHANLIARRTAGRHAPVLAWFAKEVLAGDIHGIALTGDDFAATQAILDDYLANGLPLYNPAEANPATLVTDEHIAASSRVIAASEALLAETERAESEARTARDQLAALPDDADNVENDLFAAEADMASAVAHRNTLAAQLASERGAQLASEQAAAITERATQAHIDVNEWTAIADALAPDGIPGEQASQLLKPYNDRLRQTAALTGWDQISIDNHACIRIGSRRYGMCSESARWRADAALAEAIAHVSGLRCFLLDRVDVLSPAGRIVLVKWLASLAQDQQIDSVLLFGTFKEPPHIPLAGFAIHWLEQGALAKPAHPGTA